MHLAWGPPLRGKRSEFDVPPDERNAWVTTLTEEQPHWAHERFFKHRHEDATPQFHDALISALWDARDRAVILSFRGSGKSTRAEEWVTLQACLGKFRNCLVISSSEARAAERLASVSNELKINTDLRSQWGDLVGEVWTQTKLVLKSGACIQAMGRDQDLRGLKHIDSRPDLILVDDFEDKDNVQTVEGRRKTLRWFLAELLPACDPRRRVRVLATPMDAESVPMLLIREPRPGWPVERFPIERIGAAGAPEPMWPARYSLGWIEQEKGDYEALGEIDVWHREYMCEAVSDASRVFRPEMIKVEPLLHTFQPRYAMVDPARTVRARSSMTGWALWSWERQRLIVWDAGAAGLMPDEIIDLIFRLGTEPGVVEVGVEADGLEEWLSQPIRARMSREGTIPYRGVRAPRGKTDFIRGLQPFFSSSEVTFIRELPTLRDQLLSFPTGRIDAPNALAYCLALRPGRLIYDDFSPYAHIRPVPLRPGTAYVACNATRTELTAVLVQLDEGRLRIVDDWIFEGEPGETAEQMLRTVSIRAGRALVVVLGQPHFDQWHNVGLNQALRPYEVEVRAGGTVAAGRDFIRKELARTHAGEPAIQISDSAHWTLRAFSGGYSRELRGGYPADQAADNRYRLLMEGLEAMAGLLAWGLDDQDETRNWAIDRQGRRYLSAMPGRRLDA